jgi:hypothetical protein
MQRRFVPRPPESPWYRPPEHAEPPRLADYPEVVGQLAERLTTVPVVDRVVLLTRLVFDISIFLRQLGVGQPLSEAAVLPRAQAYGDVVQQVTMAALACQRCEQVDMTRLVTTLYARWHAIEEEWLVRAALWRVAHAPVGRVQCPCCGYYTLRERGLYELCLVCFWEDDTGDEVFGEPARHGATGGPNRNLSLEQACANFQTFGASGGPGNQFVRPPHAEEMSDRPCW